jgi:uncharacterized membrane protein
MFLLPHFSRARFFFAITVAPGFRSSPEGQAIQRRYHREVAAALAGSAILVWLLAAHWPDLAVVMAGLLPIFAGLLQFLAARARVRRYSLSGQLPEDSIREAELSTESDRLPWLTALAMPAFVLPVGAAIYLRARWYEIPERFPVHWNAVGVADRWTDKTPHGVYMPLLFAAALMLFILLLGLGMFYGARRGPQRIAVLKILLAMIYFEGLVFTWVGLMPVLQLPVAWLIGGSLVFTLTVVWWCYRLATDPQMPAESTPDECWRLGAIYFNPADPAVFVQKRIGFGYTFNFGNRMSWILLAGFAAGLIGMTAAMK